MEYRQRIGLTPIDVECPDHLAPLLGVVGDELAEVRRRACKRFATWFSQPSFDLGIGSAVAHRRVLLNLQAELLD